MTGGPWPVYLLRHGETEWNLLGRYQGGFDSPLTDHGREQARAMGEQLAGLLPNAAPFRLTSSPLGRAVATATIVAERLGLSFTRDVRLREISLGSWDGLSRAQIAERFPTTIQGATRYDWYFRAPDGESVEAATLRLDAWLGSLTGPTIAVTHGLASRILRGLYMGLDRAAALSLPVPQDGLFQLAGGVATYLPGAAGSSS
jgi:broad specificity phosphatase PhoE